MSVAECDIKGFFDCVSHELAESALQEMIASATKKDPSLAIDKRALGIFQRYLAAYSFPESVLRKAQLQLQKVDPKGYFKWPEEDLKALYTPASPFDLRIGVPQGGAHSCLIANLLLHRADEAIARLSRRRRKALTYRRYCDDMILLSANASLCSEAFDLYGKILTELRLPIHKPEQVERYDSTFYDRKSNSPYRWTRPAAMDQVIPWIQFVGYQIRWDGMVRIRQRSLVAHRKKITAATDELLGAIFPKVSPPDGQGPRKSREQIIYRLRQRLVSISVGHRVLSKPFESPESMCWASGFKGLFGKRYFANVLKNLDRHRERQIRRLERALEKTPLPVNPPTKELKHLPRFSGAPFSYHDQFRKGRQR